MPKKRPLVPVTLGASLYWALEWRPHRLIWIVITLGKMLYLSFLPFEFLWAPHGLKLAYKFSLLVMDWCMLPKETLCRKGFGAFPAGMGVL